MNRRIVRKTQFFSHQMVQGECYRHRTGNEQILAEVYQNQIDDDSTIQKKSDDILNMIQKEEETKKKQFMLAKYRKMPMQIIVKELFHIRTKNKIIYKQQTQKKMKFVEMEDGVIDMTGDEDCLGDLKENVVEIINSDNDFLEKEKELILKNIFEDSIRMQNQDKSKDEIASCVLEIKNEVQCIEDDDTNYLYEIRAFEEKEKVHVMNMMIAEEIVVEKNNHMSCPIAYCIMRDPVTTSNGHIYDRNRW